MSGALTTGLAAGLAAAAGWVGAGRASQARQRLPANARPTPRLIPPGPWGGARQRQLTRLASLALVLAAASYAVIPALVAAGAGEVLRRRWTAARRMSALQRQRAADVSVLRALAAELRSGLAPSAALQAAGGSPSAARGIASRMLAAAASEALGGDAAGSLADGAEPGSPAAALAAAWTVCLRTGARLASPVGRIAHGAAADLRTAREADAALAGARSSALLLAVLPVAGIGLGALSGAGSVHVLLQTGVGQLCLLAGVALDLAGLAWLDRLTAAGRA